MPLSYELRSGDIVEVLTSKRERGPVARLARRRQDLARAQQDQAVVQGREPAGHRAPGREALQEALRKQGLPAQRITGSAVLADVIRELGFRKADDFYIALGAAKVSPKTVVAKILQRLKQGQAADGEPTAATSLIPTRRERRRPTSSSTEYGIRVEGVADVMVRMAKCCRPVPGDDIVGYISLGRGITIHRADCSNALALSRDPDRFTPVAWEGGPTTGFKVEIQVDGWDRHRLLEDLSRTFSEAGMNIVEAQCTANPPMIRNRFVVECADTQTLKATISRLRNIDSVFDAFRVTPGKLRPRVLDFATNAARSVLGQIGVVEHRIEHLRRSRRSCTRRSRRCTAPPSRSTATSRRWRRSATRCRR